MRGLLKSAAAIGLSYYLSEMLLDRFIIRSDSNDPTGVVLQAEGFGMDDVLRIATTGLVGAVAVKWSRGL